MAAREVMYFSESVDAAQRLAQALGVAARTIEAHHFPDDESRVRVPVDPAREVILYRSLDHPNTKLIELLFAANTLRLKGAQHLTLIAPYLCYMRQDAENQPGEAISQRIVGRWLAEHFDAVYTVDAHLHRVPDLPSAVPARRAVNLLASGLWGEFVAARGGRPLLIGPDAESAQWVAAMAAAAGCDSAVAVKQRLDDKTVRIQLPDIDVHAREVILVDDVVSSGGTLVTLCGLLHARGVAQIDVAVTHPLFAQEALDNLRRAGVREIWSTDSIPHATNCVQLAPLWLQALTRG